MAIAIVERFKRESICALSPGTKKSVCYSGEVVVSRDSTGSLMIRFYTAWQKFYSELTIPMECPKYFSANIP